MKRFTFWKDGTGVDIDCVMCSRNLSCVDSADCADELESRLYTLESAVEKLEKQLEAKEQSLSASVNHYYREGIQDARKLLADALAETKNGGN